MTGIFIMNEFFVASSRSVSVGEITVHQLQMHNFDEWGIAASEVKKYLKTHLGEINTALIKAHTGHVLTLLSKSTHLDETVLISMAEASEALLIQLVDAMIKVNDAFFGEKEPKRKSRRNSQSNKDADQANWFDNFQLLIESGHHQADIMQMTYGAFISYLKAAQKQRSQNLLTNTHLMRAAQHAKDKAYAKLTDELKPSED